MGAYLLLYSKDRRDKSLTPKDQVGVMMELGTFTLNLADKDRDAYIRISITVELSDEKVRQEVEKRLPIIKDAVIDVISSKTSSFVKTPEGRESLRLELIKRLNSVLVEGGIRNIYFTEFVVQTS